MTYLVDLDQESAPPVFILSAPRTGSTLLRYLLDTHSRICCPGELLLGRLCQDLRNVVHWTLGQVVGGKESVAELVARESRRLVAGLMGTYAKAKGKQIWCEKTPGNLEYLEDIADLFPDARYICLYRNGMDVVHSSLEVSKHGFMDGLSEFVAQSPDNLVAAMIDSWSDKTAKLLAFERRNPERCFRLRYESIVSDPSGSLGQLIEFLGLEWEPEMLEQVFSSAHDEGGGDPKVKFTREIDPRYIGKGANIRLELIPADRQEKMNRLLEDLGYPKVGASWNSRPSSDPPTGPVGGFDEILSVGDLFAVHVPGVLKENAEQLASTKASFKFVTTGKDPGIWVVEVKDGSSQVFAGDRAADCTIITEADVLLAIANKRVNAFTASQEGKITVEGVLELVYKVPLFL